MKILLFFYLLFLSNRILFIIYFHERYSAYNREQLTISFLYGLRYDTAMALLLTIIPAFFIMIQYLSECKLSKTFLNVYLIVTLILNCFCLAFDIGIYDLSQIHLNFRILHYIKFLSHGIQFSDSKLNAVYYSMLFAQVVFGILLLWWLFYKLKIGKYRRKPLWLITAFTACTIFFGFYKASHSELFSTNNIFDPDSENLVDLSTNVLYNIGREYLRGENARHKNPYQFREMKQAAAIVNNMKLQRKDSVTKLFKTDRPNIVLFMLESFTADVIAPLGGDTGVTPTLSAIIKDGLLFSNIYSPGYRTDQGLACLLNGFPAIPDFSIEMDTKKSRQLPFITHNLMKAGYNTNLYYGGDLDFANMKTYFKQTGIQRLNDSHSFPKHANDPKWGVHDEYVFLKQAREAAFMPAPFFSMIISLSSHEPFVLPIQPKFPGKDLIAKFKNCCFYTDQSIGKYFDSVKNTAWYKNTIFVFVADHGHNFPRNRRLNEQGRFHIPMIIYGKPLKQAYRGATMEQLGMQNDFSSTILSQLKIPHDEFSWSNDLMKTPRNDFVYYCFDSGMGWIDKEVNMKMDLSSGTTKIYSGDHAAGQQEKAKAYLQTLFNKYVSY